MNVSKPSPQSGANSSSVEAVRPLSLLYVEDSDLDAELVTGRLMQSGLPVEVERVTNRTDFLKRLKSGCYDLILSDYRVPTFDGLEVLQLSKEHQPAVPLIYVSGAMGEELAVEALKQGATDFILKDRLARLPSAIERAAAEARGHHGRLHAEAALKASEERLNFVLRSSGIGFWYCDLPLGELNWDRRVKEHFHFPAHARITVDDFFDRLHPDDREPTRHAIEMSIQTRQPYDVDYRTVDPLTGKENWIRAIGQVYYSSDDIPVRFDGLTIDVTDRKKAMDELEKLYAQQRDNDRRKDEFLATLAHELRNPLAPIRTGLALLRMTDISPELEGTCAMMQRQVNHMVRLVDDLLDVSRVTRGTVELKKEPVTLRAIFDAALEVSRPAIHSSRHGLFLSMPETDLHLLVDPTRMAQVVANLLNNAAKYTPEGGRIELTGEQDAQDIVIRVRDNGVGIPPEMLTKVFEMFTQIGRSLDRAQGGLGIGLGLVHKIVELHGGTITAESRGPGKGSTFIVRLPRALTASPRSEKDGRHPPSSTTTVSRRILVVDDNADGATTLSLLLKFLGHESRTAFNGPEALEEATQFRPELVLLDIGLPGMNGYEVATRMRSDAGFPAPILVALTGWGSEDDRQRAKDAGFDYHLTKPIDASHVSEVLARFFPQSSAPPVAGE